MAVPTITEVRTYAVSDDNPDLSWLDQTDDQMGEGFEEQSADRKATYGTVWGMIGIRATAEVVVNGTTQYITSPGLWGIEDDSDRAYLKEVQTEELNTLSDILVELGFPKLAVCRAIDAAELLY